MDEVDTEEVDFKSVVTGGVGKRKRWNNPQLSGWEVE